MVKFILPYEKNIKHVIWCFANTMFIIIFFKVTLWKIAALLILLAFIYIIINIFNENYFYILLITIPTILIFYKFLHLVLPKNIYINYFYIIGLSYLVLKLIHYIFVSHNKMIGSTSLFSFLNYLLFFPVFSSGPITLYQGFVNEIEKDLNINQSFHYFTKGVKRIILGLFKIYFLSQYTSLFSFFNLDSNHLLDAPIYLLIIYAHVSVLDLYLNFSGYCDLATGISNLFLIDIPENFNYPFIARNLHEFWQRWHITLADWLKVYIFMPTSKELFGSNYLSDKIYVVQPIAIFITFFLMGVWHGLELNFLIYGLFQGFGLFVVMFFDFVLKSKKMYQRYHSIKFIRIISWFLTMNYFALSLLLFNATSQNKLNTLWVIIFS